MNYSYWKAAMAGEKPAMFVDDPQLGFFRKGIYERNEKGNNRRVGWSPVAIYMAGGEITAQVGDNIVLTDRDKINELWSYCAANSISEEWYRAVAERGEAWPDAHSPKANRAPKLAQDAEKDSPPDTEQGTPERSPEQKLLDELAEHAKGIPTYAKIEDDNLLSKAHDLRDKIKKIENAAESERKKEKDFYLKKGREIDDKWRGVILTAQARYAEISAPMNKWVNDKLETQRLQDERVAAQQKAHDEAVAAAEAANRPAPPPPEPPAPSNTPAPSMQVRSGGGARASNVRTHKVVTITDEAAVYKHFAGSQELTAVLLKLATIATNAGLNVPGTTSKQEAKV